MYIYIYIYIFLATNSCLSTPCLNGACVNSPSGYTCNCNRGYTGYTCQTGNCNYKIIIL